MPAHKNHAVDFEKLEEIGNTRWDNDPDFNSTESIFDLAIAGFNFRIDRVVQNEQSFSNDIHFIIVHSPEHVEWAGGIEKQVIDSVTDLFPAIKITTQFLSIHGTITEVTEALAQCYAKTHGVITGKAFIVTPGWRESQMVSAANVNKALPYPQLFCLSGIPGRLLHDAGSTGDTNVLGGVFSMPPAPTKYVNAIVSFKPDTRVVCIAYDKAPTSPEFAKQIAAQVKGIEDAFAQKNISVIHHHWTPEDSNMAHLRSSMYAADSAIILHEPAAAMHAKRLIRLCKVLGKFICSSELDSVYAGAAIGYGVPGSAFGIPLARLVANYLLDWQLNRDKKVGWYLYQIPDQDGMRYNELAFGMQGIELSEEKEALLRMKSAFDRDCVEL